MGYRAPRGTFDIISGDIEKWQWVEQKAREICECFNYHEIRTPYFEETALFERGVGEATDIVEKEMYSFSDRGGRSLTLRPEGTAGVVRAFVEKKIFNSPEPTKWYYIGPMFRYERPQAGRNRQFHQFGVEAFGGTDPAVDAEIISLGYSYFAALGLKNIRVIVNSVGDPESRAIYRAKLIDYFHAHQDQLSEEAKLRLYKNPMRILDSKDPKIKEIAAKAPSILDYLSEKDKTHFHSVLEYLELLGISYEVNHQLVRGLDYYQQTAFEYMLDIPGSQASTLGGGGRYHGLVQEFGGPQTPGIGFGIGLERVLLALEHQNVQMPRQKQLDCYLIGIGEKAKSRSIKILHELRLAGLVVDMDYLNRKMKAQFKTADRVGARFVAILGESELAIEKIQMKNLATGTQNEVEIENLTAFLKQKKAGEA